MLEKLSPRFIVGFHVRAIVLLTLVAVISSGKTLKKGESDLPRESAREVGSSRRVIEARGGWLK